jgi:hypothetical protein
LWWDKSLKFWPEVENITTLKKNSNKNFKKIFHDTHVQHQYERRYSGKVLVKKIFPKMVWNLNFLINIFEKSIRFPIKKSKNWSGTLAVKGLQDPFLKKKNPMSLLVL